MATKKHIEAVEKEIEFLKKISISMLQHKKMNRFYHELTGFTILGILRESACYLCKTSASNCSNCIFVEISKTKCSELDFWNKLQDLTINNNTEMMRAVKEYYKALEVVYKKYKESSKDE